METRGDFAQMDIDRTAYAVKLPIFEGPLDLLLHLIRQSELEITDVSIGAIADQYLGTLDLMRELNLEVAGEYLLMAATLAWIKSRALLSPDVEEDPEEVDPQADLLARLLEYRRFREVSEELGERPLLGRDVFRPEPTPEDPTAPHEREIEVHLVSLVDAFRSILRRGSEEVASHEVQTEQITVRERMTVVMDLLVGVDNLEFESLFDCEGEGLPSRPVLIATFLAILELARLAAIRVYQGFSMTGKPEGPIRLRRSGSEGELWRQGVSELM